MFKPNDKVVCVDVTPNEQWRRYKDGAFWTLHLANISRLKLDEVYVVASIIPGGPVFDEPGVEIVGVPHTGARGWLAKRFRKLDDIKAENEMLEQIELRPLKLDVPTLVT